MKVGDLVICNCPGSTWYKGLVGMVIGFVRNGVPRDSSENSEAVVLYGNTQTVELIAHRLQVVS